MNLNRVALFFPIVLLSACSTPPSAPDVSAPPTPITPISAPIETTPPIGEGLEAKRQHAKQNQQWLAFIDYSRLLWLQADNAEQAQLERDTWQTLQQLDRAARAQLAQSDEPTYQDWGWLLQAAEAQGYAYKRELEDLRQLLEQTWFNRHLLEELIAEFDRDKLYPTIGVILPFTERYRAISEQVRAGLLKAYWQTNSPHSLLFFDLKEQDDVLALYHQAKQAGARVVIGPFTQPELNALAQAGVHDMIGLNDLDVATEFWQFNPRNTDENAALIERLQQDEVQRPALLATDRYQRQANELQTRWNADHPIAMNAHLFAENTPNVKAEIAKLLNTDKSEGRAGYLRRTIGRSLEFFPRTRQDIDAILLVGNEQAVAMIQPQLEYYALRLPLYGTSQLTPARLADNAPVPDLKHISLQTLAAALTPSPLRTRLEAFGWDSYQLARHFFLLSSECVIHSAGGNLRLDPNQRIKTQLLWAQYNANGKISPAEKVLFSPLPPADTHSLRDVLLEEILLTPPSASDAPE